MISIQEFLNIPQGLVVTKSEESLLNILRTNELIHKFANLNLFNGEVSISQFNILMILGHEDKKGISQKDIGQRLVTSKGNTSLHINHLEKKELIYRKTDKDDRRFNVIFLSAKGKRLLKKLEPMYRQLMQQLFNSIDCDDLEALNRCLNHLRDNLLSYSNKGMTP